MFNDNYYCVGYIFKLAGTSVAPEDVENELLVLMEEFNVSFSTDNIGGEFIVRLAFEIPNRIQETPQLLKAELFYPQMKEKRMADKLLDDISFQRKVENALKDVMAPLRLKGVKYVQMDDVVCDPDISVEEVVDGMTRERVMDAAVALSMFKETRLMTASLEEAMDVAAQLLAKLLSNSK